MIILVHMYQMLILCQALLQESTLYAVIILQHA